MAANDLLERLFSRFPEFAQQWNDPDNLFRNDDGSFTEWGVFSEFALYIRDNYQSLQLQDLQLLALWIEENLAAEAEPVSNAVATCFLENLAGEPAIEYLKRFLGVRARRFLMDSGWG
jgi:hypothetical protein